MGASTNLRISPPSYLAPNGFFAIKSVEQQWTELPYKLRGNKIGSWGRSSPVGAPKEKPPCDQSTPKNRVASENLRVFGKRIVPSLARASAQRPPGFAVYGFHTRKQVKQQACQLLFCNFFLFGKEKSGTFSFLQKAFSKSVVCSQRKRGTFSFYKRKELCPVGRQSKSQIVPPFHLSKGAHSRSVGRHRKEPRRFPLREFV